MSRATFAGFTGSSANLAARNACPPLSCFRVVSPPSIAGSAFPATRWSLVVDLSGDEDARRSDALGTLCETYWYPLYAYIRRAGKAPEDARDLAQGFFLDLFERDTLAQADPSRGRMRTFLLTALKRFLAKQHRRDTALKRGAGRLPVSIDERDAEGRYLAEPADVDTPERQFERGWASALFDRTLGRLREHFEQTGKAANFDVLKEYLAKDESSQSYAQLATQLDMSEGAVGVAIFRMRKRFRTLLREEIEDTLADGESFDEELRHLHAIFQNRNPTP